MNHDPHTSRPLPGQELPSPSLRHFFPVEFWISCAFGSYLGMAFLYLSFWNQRHSPWSKDFAELGGSPYWYPFALGVGLGLFCVSVFLHRLHWGITQPLGEVFSFLLGTLLLLPILQGLAWLFVPEPYRQVLFYLIYYGGLPVIL